MANGLAAEQATAIFTDDSFGNALGQIFGGVFSTVNTHLNNQSAENIAGISGQYVPPGSVGAAGANSGGTDAGLIALLGGLLGRENSASTNQPAANPNMVLYIVAAVVVLALLGLVVVMAVRGGAKKG